jgi:uncharacterized repeat protein (TIGR01451 family)
MGRKLVLALALVATVLGIGAAFSSAAEAAPKLDVKGRWAPQVLKPGENGLYILRVRNYGDEDTSGTVTVTQQLPPGVTRIEPAPFDEMFELEEGFGWKCEGVTTVVCTTENAVREFNANMPYSIGWTGGSGRKGAPGYAPQIYIQVAVDPAAEGEHTSSVTVSGGGSAAASDDDPVRIADEATQFGFTPGSGAADVFDGEYPAGDPVRQAGAHPFELRVDFDLNLRAGAEESLLPGLLSPFVWSRPVGTVRTVRATLPKGLIGNPEATPKCKPEDFLRAGSAQYTSTACAPETQVGVITLMLNDFANSTYQHGDSGLFSPASWTRIPVYNLDPPKGYPADFGFDAGDFRGHIYPTINPGRGYAIEALTPYVSSLLPVRSAEFTMWGVPADPAHDHLRSIPIEQGGTPEVSYGSSSKAPIKPLLTLPVSCYDHGKFILEADSDVAQDQWVATDLTSDPLAVEGCNDPRVKFKPEVALQPTSTVAGGPTGLQVNLKAPQKPDTVNNAQELYEQNGDIQAIATPPLKKAVVTMPEGMTISTSAAQGLGSCAPSQIKLGTNDPVTCPANSQYGTLTLRTPILPKDAPMEGKIYIAKQNENPFGNFLSLYLVVEDRDRGLLVKIPGKVDLDPVSGQITTTFDDLPEFPVSDMELNLKGGVRAALVNPTTCGEKTITARFYSWADPNTPITGSSSYRVTSKADGSPCVADLAGRPFAPAAQGGTVNPSAGAYSPFVYRVQRSDDDQELSALRVDLPKGLLARIAGVAKCPEAAIAAAQAPGRSGTEEANSPSCPASSLIGSTDAGSGVGQVLTYVPGKLYLAGPYKGAPLSMVAITPVLAGPYDLGVIAVRTKLEVDPTTAQASAVTDPLPQIFKGIPVRIRDLRIKVDREQTTLNPTSCAPTAVASLLTGTGGLLGSTADDTQASVANRFQAVNCASLAFKPRLKLSLAGSPKRAGHPAVRAQLTFPQGTNANISKAEVLLPPTQLIDNANVNNPCTRDQFAAEACPASSILGTARAYTPLLDEPLEGKVYFRSNGGVRTLPDLVADLRGDIRVVLVGWIDSVGRQGSEKRRIRTRFMEVPDAPVTKFEMRLKGGKKGLIVNNTNICRSKARAIVKMDAQNGMVHDFKSKVGKRCGGRTGKGR